jgi:hypothetical protein
MRPFTGAIGLPSAVTSAVQLPLYARTRSRYERTTPSHVTFPSWMAFCMPSIVDSSTRKPCARASAGRSNAAATAARSLSLVDMDDLLVNK